MTPVLRRRGRQEEKSDEVLDQVSIGRQNPVLKELDPVVGSTGGLTVEQLAAEIGEIRHEMRTLIELLAEQRQSRQD